MNDILYVSNERDKQYIESLQKELDKYQDKVYHSTRLIEQLEHELELLRKVIQLQREGLEYYGDLMAWDSSSDLFYNTIEGGDVELIERIIEGQDCSDYYAGKLARQTLKEVDELLKGEK